MPLEDIVHVSQLYIDEKKPVVSLSLIDPSAKIVGKYLHDMLSSSSWYNKQLDLIEYGMGFQRGELNDTVQQDMADAFNDYKWTLAPEEEHLQYLAELWWKNLQCPPDQRERHIPLEKGLRKSRSGRTFYSYNFYRVDSFPIYTIDGTLTQSGTTRVWSAIPPYIWLVVASTFLREHFSAVPVHLCWDKHRLRVVYDMMRKPLPGVFISSLPQPQRRPPYVENVEEAQM
ncbi:hypothetical protein C0993_000781 [Termitomyces sp. T159_Od127]|nr:hypothetical protein C0993_000781 [Termitomyces sp. T159_Od127]